MEQLDRQAAQGLVDLAVHGAPPLGHVGTVTAQQRRFLAGWHHGGGQALATLEAVVEGLLVGRQVAAGAGILGQRAQAREDRAQLALGDFQIGVDGARAAIGGLAELGQRRPRAGQPDQLMDERPRAHDGLGPRRSRRRGRRVPRA